MKKALFGLIILLVAAGYTLAQEPGNPTVVGKMGLSQIRLKDVPDDHWAASAVYDLVKLGVTKGYPDGTYRGDKPINRYETAIFLSKLAKAVAGDDIKADIKALRDQLVEIKTASKEALRLKGNYEGDWKGGNVLSKPVPGSVKASAANYRLIMTAEKDLAENANVKINLDTMDFGFFDDGTKNFPGKGALASELLDIESNIRLSSPGAIFNDPVDLKLTYGPGAKQHVADPTNAFPSEVGVIYKRPDTGVAASTKLFGADVIGGYRSVQGTTLDATGRINSGWLSGTISYTLEKFLLLNSLKVGFTGDYISHGSFSTTDRSVRTKFDVSAPLGDKAEASTTVALGKTTSQMMVKGSVSLKDPLDTGTVITIQAAKIGAEYIDRTFVAQQVDLAGLDGFDRPLENGTVNLGGQLVQTVSDRTKLIGKGDIRLAGDYKYQGDKARLTAQGGIEYNLAPNVNLDAAYRVHQDKSTGDTSDLAAVGLMYRF
ncbi:MAG: S-layer homology domain-containing protein [Candidatus Margulisbacteria bacterium]|nr:S-layer homology domain-containing protein [Candidatus Margulisiibacteriota bacterium]